VIRHVCALSLAILLIGRGASAEERITLPTRPGVTETFLFLPAPQPVANVIFFPGGDGVIAGEADNFVLRIRDRFPAEGLTVAVLDAPSDQAGGLTIDFRAGAAVPQDTTAIVAFLRNKAPVPVWLLGTSNGSISAANVAAHIGPTLLAGIVLTSSVWSGGMSKVPLGEIAVPVLVVHNRDDSCRLSPFAGTAAGLAALVKAPSKELLAVSGGRPAGPPCKAHSAHGYYGIEDQVVPQMIAWIKAHPPAAR
jgi:hypothetical protein